MNRLGVDRSVILPTLASLVEKRMCDDPALMVHALHQWLDQVWGVSYHDPIFIVLVVSLPIVENAIEELDWVGVTWRADDSGAAGLRFRLQRSTLVRGTGVRLILAAMCRP